MLAWALMVAAWGQPVPTPEHELNRARLCIGELDFDCATRALSSARARIDILAPSLAEEVLLLSAEVALSTDHFREAEPFLVDVLIRNPSFEPPPGAWPPAWQKALEKARSRVPDHEGPTITIDPIEPVLAGTPIVVRAHVEDPSGIRQVTLHLTETPLEVTMTSTQGTIFTGIIPAQAAVPPAIRFWIAAHDAYGNGPGVGGGTDAIYSVQISTPPSAPPRIYETWWFWTAVGTVVVGAAVTGVALATAGSEPSSLRLEVGWP